jgi:hypothetical protein
MACSQNLGKQKERGRERGRERSDEKMLDFSREQKED